MIMNKCFNICRRFFCGIFVILAVISLCACTETAEKELKPTQQFFINDFANVVDSDTRERIVQKGAALQESTTAQVVAVTVKTTDGTEISDYALELGRNWGIGQKDKSNGVLIILATEDRQIYIAVGYGLEGALPDSKTGRILDNYAIPYLKSDDFSEGLYSCYNAIVNEVYIEYGEEPEEGYIPVSELSEQSEQSAKKVVVSWLALLIIVSIYIIVARKFGIRIFFGPGFFGGGHGGGFGGFGGGSSGGFGGFSGGGGSFGGGGAGRGF